MIAYAQNHSGVTAWQATFDQFKAQDIYDGIWASFSLLHAAREDIPTFLQNIHSAIKSGGVLYIAMKLGVGVIGMICNVYTPMSVKRNYKAGFRMQVLIGSITQLVKHLGLMDR